MAVTSRAGRRQATMGEAMARAVEREHREAVAHATYWQAGRRAETATERYLQACAHRPWLRDGHGVVTLALLAEEQRQRVGYLTPWGGWRGGEWVMGRKSAEIALRRYTQPYSSWCDAVAGEIQAEIDVLADLLAGYYAGRNCEYEAALKREIVLQFPPCGNGTYISTISYYRGKEWQCEYRNGEASGLEDLKVDERLQVYQALAQREGLLPFEMVVSIAESSARQDARAIVRRRLVAAGRKMIARLILKWSAWYEGREEGIGKREQCNSRTSVVAAIERKWGKCIGQLDDRQLADEVWALMEGVGAHTGAAWRLQRRAMWEDGLAAVETEAAAYLAEPGCAEDVSDHGALEAYEEVLKGYLSARNLANGEW